VWEEYGVSSSLQAKQLDQEVRGGAIFLPFTEALKTSLDPAAYPRARRALCEALVGFVSKVNIVATAWWQFVYVLRDFVVERSDVVERDYYFLAEMTIRVTLPRRPRRGNEAATAQTLGRSLYARR